MIRQIYEVTYNERFGYANTYEEAKQMEENFKSSFNGGQLSPQLIAIIKNIMQ